jgi:hypothetical protein
LTKREHDRLSLLANGLAVAVWPRVSGGTRQVIGLGNIVVALTSFAIAMVASSYGGGALNGRVAVDAYFLMQHGSETRVTRATYYGVAAVEILLFVSWPMTFILHALDAPNVDRLRSGRPTLVRPPDVE